MDTNNQPPTGRSYLETTVQKRIGSDLHHWYDSFEELLYAIDNMSPHNRKVFNETVNDRLFAPEQWWNGLRTFSQIKDKLKNGWPEYLARVKQAAQSLDDKLVLSEVAPALTYGRRRKRVASDYGDTLHMPKVWAGHLDRAWDRPVRAARVTHTQRYASVFIDLCGHNQRDAEDAIWRAAVGMRTCDLFTQLGYAVEIWVGDSSRLCYPGSAIEKSWNAVRVKEYQQPLNEDRLATMSSMFFFRSFGFGFIAAGPANIDSTFGYPYNNELPLVLRERAEQGERIIRISECWSRDDAKRQMGEIIKQLSVEPVSLYA